MKKHIFIPQLGEKEHEAMKSLNKCIFVRVFVWDDPGTGERLFFLEGPPPFGVRSFSGTFTDPAEKSIIEAIDRTAREVGLHRRELLVLPTKFTK